MAKGKRQRHHQHQQHHHQHHQRHHQHHQQQQQQRCGGGGAEADSPECFDTLRRDGLDRRTIERNQLHVRPVLKERDLLNLEKTERAELH